MEIPEETPAEQSDEVVNSSDSGDDPNKFPKSGEGGTSEVTIFPKKKFFLNPT